MAGLAGLKRGFPVPGLRVSEILIVGAGTLFFPRAPATRRGSAATQFVTWAVLYVIATGTLGTLDLLRLGQPFSEDAIGKLIGPLEFLVLFVAVRRPPARTRTARRLCGGSWWLRCRCRG